MRVGAIGYCTAQGLGHLLKSFYDARVVQDVALVPHGVHPNHYDWYPPESLVLHRRPFLSHYRQQMAKFLSSIDILLCFETPFDWTIFQECRARGVKSVLMPMYEWTPRSWPVRPDALVCPSHLDYDIFYPEFGPGKIIFLPVPVDPSTWKLRTKAERFLHNAGHVGHREHKGTRQFIEAIPLVKSPAQFTIRCQEPKALDSILAGNKSVRNDERVTIQAGDWPRERLFDDHDVYVAPEKFNGLSLPLQEARAAGLLVMTTDRYPANTWLPKGPLIPAQRTELACITRNYREFDESIVAPVDIAAKIDEWYGQSIEIVSETGRLWAQEHSWEVLKPRYLEALEAIRGL